VSFASSRYRHSVDEKADQNNMYGGVVCLLLVLWSISFSRGAVTEMRFHECNFS